MSDEFYSMIANRIDSARMYQSLFSTEEGKAVLKSILQNCLIDIPVYSPGKSTEETLFRAGMQNVGYIIKDFMSLNIEQERLKLEELNIEYDALGES